MRFILLSSVTVLIGLTLSYKKILMPGLAKNGVPGVK